MNYLDIHRWRLKHHSALVAIAVISAVLLGVCFGLYFLGEFHE